MKILNSFDLVVNDINIKISFQPLNVPDDFKWSINVEGAERRFEIDAISDIDNIKVDE